MYSKIEPYIKAVKSIHSTENFWIFDNTGKNIYLNHHSEDYLNQFKFYQNASNSLYNYQELLDKLPSNTQITKSGMEIIGISLDEVAPNGVLFEITPIQHDNEIIGFFMLDQGNVANFEYTHLMSTIMFSNLKKLYHKDLSLRELEIIYFIIRGKTYEEIAVFLSKIYNKPLSPSCVGKLVRNSLYEKFDVWNKFDLKHALLTSNYVKHIPISVYKALSQNISF